MADIIQFPGMSNLPPAVPDLEEAQEMELAEKVAEVDKFLDYYMPMLFQSAMNRGFDLSDRKFNNINGLFVQAFRAALLKVYGIKHPLQEFADESVREAQRQDLNDNEPDETE